MKRSPVNPWQWSVPMGFNQAEIVEGARRQLQCSGQTAVDTNGAPQHLENMRQQMVLVMDNLDGRSDSTRSARTDVRVRSQSR